MSRLPPLANNSALPHFACSKVWHVLTYTWLHTRVSPSVFVINTAVRTTNCCCLQTPRPPSAKPSSFQTKNLIFWMKECCQDCFKKVRARDFSSLQQLPCCLSPGGPPDRTLQSVLRYSKPPGSSESSAASGFRHQPGSPRQHANLAPLRPPL